jgi:hypothetical protein
VPTCAWAIPTANASKHQAATSLMAAHPSASVPSGVFCIRLSVSIRASTGKAVIEVATPMNRAKLVNGTSVLDSRG